MNLSSQRVWCYLCESEIFLQNQHNRYHQRANSLDSNSENSRRIFQYNHEFHNDKGNESSYHRGGYDSEIDDDEIDHQGQLNGLVGLKNIANTCYMNSAIQALSNSPPLTGYFLECANIVQNSTSRTKVGLAKSYQRLVRDMWLNRHRGYIVPDEIIRGISSIHPIFRGYQQHDTQEFLRCFMDQLHEELKEVTPPPPESTVLIDEEMNSPCPSPSSLSQSEAEEYETCDSGVSEQSSLSDEIQSVNRPRMTSRTPSPLRSVSSSAPTVGSSILTNRTGSNASLTSVQSNGGSASNNNNSQQQQSKESPSSTKQQPKVIHRSIISDIFDGKLLSSVQCLTCDRVSTREETFQDLSLPIPGRDYLNMLHQSQNPIGMPPLGLSLPTNLSNSGMSSAQSCTDVSYQVQDTWMWWLWNWFRSWFYGPAVTLHDCMNAFFSADELKGDNMYSCEKCNKLRNGVKFSRVLALPEMLCVHLKRFRHDLSYSSKISSPVIFPLTGLDMRQYLHKDCKSKVSTYDLTAIICHHGTVGSGHYICYAKHAPTDKW
jgi:ubiquitin carboxyl-terminal hydrolase 20/33